MAVKVLKDNLVIDNRAGRSSFSTSPSQWTYRILHDEDNNNYIVEITGGFDQLRQPVSIPTTNVIWKNDGFSPDVSNYFTNQYELTQDILNRTVYQELQKYAKLNTRANGVPLPAWAKSTTGTSNAAPPGQSTNNTPPTPATAQQQPSLGGFNINDIPGQLQTILTAINNPQQAIQGVVDGGFGDTFDKEGNPTNGNYQNSENLVYPVELKGANHYSSADLLLIEQFEYIPVNKNEFIDNLKGNSILRNGMNKENDNRFNNVSLVGGSVSLPMPQSFEERKGVQYGEDTMNNLAAGVTQDVLGNMGEYTAAMGLGAAAGVIPAFLQGKAPGVSLGGLSGMAKFGVAARALYGIGESIMDKQNTSGRTLLSTTVSSLMLKAAGMNVAAETILARGAGIIPNPNMELLFRSPELRTFGFAYRLTARSQDEAKEIRKIIRFFKQGMSPKRQNGQTNYFLKTPNMFRVQFKTIKGKGNDKDGLNKSMPKFKTCALKGFTTDYSPDKMWAAYEDGQPVSVNIVMEFGELSPIYADDYSTFDIDDIGF